MKKEAEGILCALRREADVQKILLQNEQTFVERPLCEALSALLVKSGLSRAQAIEMCIRDRLLSDRFALTLNVFAARRASARCV